MNQYYYYLPIIFFISGLKDISAQFCKASGKAKIYAIEGITSSIFLFGFSIIFLAIFHLEIHGYLLAILISQICSFLYLSLAGRITSCYKKHNFEKDLLKDMLRYSIPLVPNSFSWWVIQTSDRYMVAWLIGDYANGQYTMAYKIPSMLGVISDIFMQAWALSAIDEYDGEKDFQRFTSVYESFEASLVIISSIVLCLNQPIATILYGKEFIDAGIYAPLLIYALLFNNVQAFFGSIYNAAKKTKELMYSSLGTAIINIVLNALFIPSLGVYGAIISTCISYMLLAVLRIVGSRKYIPFSINYRIMIINFILILLQAFIEIFIKDFNQKTIFAVMVLLLLICINRNRILTMITNAKIMIEKRVNIIKQ